MEFLCEFRAVNQTASLHQLLRKIVSEIIAADVRFHPGQNKCVTKTSKLRITFAAGCGLNHSKRIK